MGGGVEAQILMTAGRSGETQHQEKQELKEKMKESSSEPQKKKLKQARLPFQILSPGVKTPVSSPALSKKRKASDSVDDDVVIVESTDVKENQVTLVEKKPKVNCDNSSRSHGKLDSDEHLHEEFQSTADKEETYSSIEKRDKTITPKSYSNKKKKEVYNKKEVTKKSSELKVSECGQINSDTTSLILENSAPIAVVVDLCDSPCKENKESDRLFAHKDVSNFKAESSSASYVAHKKPSSQSEMDEIQINSNNKNKKIEFDTCIMKQTKVASGTNYQEKVDTLEGDENVEVEPKTMNSEELVSDKELTQSHINKKQSKPNCDKADVKQPTIIDMVRNVKSSPKAPLSVLNPGKTKETKNINTCEISQKENEINKDSMVPQSPASRPPLDDSLLNTPSSANDSLASVDVSPTSSSNSATPVSSRTSGKGSSTTSAKKMTPKLLMKLKEKEEKTKEKERLKQEKEKKKAEEREEKLKLKQEKEEEKRKEREEKEKKKHAEIAQKNEEKRLKEEEKRLKDEEKKARDEEKRKKDEDEKKKREEKMLKEEQKNAEKRKSAQAFASFFVKAETKSVAEEEKKQSSPIKSYFQPFEVKNDMRLAPVCRVQLSVERLRQLEQGLDVEKSYATAPTLYLQQLRSTDYRKGSAPKTWPSPDVTDDDVIFIESEKPNEEIDTENGEIEKKTEKRRQRAKLLQFHENRRPPYWGTWRKKSKFIRPKAPLNLDKVMFEYDIDSDDEWEEPEDGESLRGSEDDESQDEQYEEDDDMFVPHGYLSDEEGQDELDDKSPEAMKAKLKFLQMEFEAERNEKQEKLKPRLIGCVWFCNSESDSASVGSHIAELFLSRRAVWEGSLPVSLSGPLPSSPVTPADANDSEESRRTKRKIVHDSMIPQIIRTLHGSRRKLSRMLVELRAEQTDKKLQPSKRCLADKIRELASWTIAPETGHHCWYVKEEVRTAYGLLDLCIAPVAAPRPPSSPALNITKFTKVLTSDERLRLLRELPTGGSSSVKGTAKSNELQPRLVAADGAKTPTVKLAVSSPVVKKRVPLLVSVPPGQPLPKDNPNSIKNFMQSSTKTLKCTETKNTANCELNSAVKQVEKQVKAVKRITPITLTTSVTKPPLPPKDDDCVVLSD